MPSGCGVKEGVTKEMTFKMGLMTKGCFLVAGLSDGGVIKFVITHVIMFWLLCFLS